MTSITNQQVKLPEITLCSSQDARIQFMSKPCKCGNHLFKTTQESETKLQEIINKDSTLKKFSFRVAKSSLAHIKALLDSGN